MTAGVQLREWYQTFRRVVRRSDWAEPLREAALTGQLGPWTESLSGAVVAACTEHGWAAVARGHEAEVLPIRRFEYLGIDVMAFPQASALDWRWPVAAFELENRADLDQIAYSVWKVCVIRCAFGGVFCYRQSPEQIGPLVQALAQGIMARLQPEMQVLLVVGTRNRAEDFPDGFFRPYQWDRSARQFRLLH